MICYFADSICGLFRNPPGHQDEQKAKLHPQCELKTLKPLENNKMPLKRRTFPFSVELIFGKTPVILQERNRKKIIESIQNYNKVLA